MTLDQLIRETLDEGSIRFGLIKPTKGGPKNLTLCRDNVSRTGGVTSDFPVEFENGEMKLAKLIVHLLNSRRELMQVLKAVETHTKQLHATPGDPLETAFRELAVKLHSME